jgi:hypothetical protein
MHLPSCVQSEPILTELVLRVPKDKPPVIGILFRRAKYACEINADFIDAHGDKKFYIRFLKKNNYAVDLQLCSDQLQAHREYRDVKVDPVKLENFLYVTRGRKEFVFAHLLHDFDQFFAVYTSTLQKRFELKLEKILFTEAETVNPLHRA